MISRYRDTVIPGYRDTVIPGYSVRALACLVSAVLRVGENLFVCIVCLIGGYRTRSYRNAAQYDTTAVRVCPCRVMTVPLYHCTTALQALAQEQAERLARAQAELAGARAELANQRAALVAEHAERGRKWEVRPTKCFLFLFLLRDDY